MTYISVDGGHRQRFPCCEAHQACFLKLIQRLVSVVASPGNLSKPEDEINADIYGVDEVVDTTTGEAIQTEENLNQLRILLMVLS